MSKLNLDTPEKKALALDLLVFSDQVNENGEKARRTSYPKTHYRGLTTLKTRLIENMESLIQFDDGEGGLKQEWFVSTDKEAPKGQILSERLLGSELELTDKEVEALKFYYKDREELPATSAETFDWFEKNIK